MVDTRIVMRIGTTHYELRNTHSRTLQAYQRRLTTHDLEIQYRLGSTGRQVTLTRETGERAGTRE